MNYTLTNNDFLATGIFGTLNDEDGKELATTLQHAYDSGRGDGSFLPKLPPGVYTCVRGQHQLEGMTHPFETFEITGVPGHTSILFHSGNYNADSSGCVLLGNERNGDMIMNSKVTFQAFMDLQKDVDSFILTVI